MNKKIVIIGSEGKVGKYFRRYLSKKNKIISIDNKKIDRKNYYQCDITNEEQIKKLTINIIKKKIKIDCVINFAHYKGPTKLTPNANFFNRLVDYPLDQWEKTLKVNLTGLFLTTKYFSKIFSKQGYGNFIFTSSTYGLVSPNPSIYGDSGINSPIGYSTTKSGVINFTKYVAVHLAKKNIIANCLVPGGIKDKKQSKVFVKKYSSLTPLNRMSNCDDYTKAIDFLINPGSYMTGSIVVVDGGWSIW